MYRNPRFSPFSLSAGIPVVPFPSPFQKTFPTTTTKKKMKEMNQKKKKKNRKKKKKKTMKKKKNKKKKKKTITKSDARTR